jgi:hypothetical protein
VGILVNSNCSLNNVRLPGSALRREMRRGERVRQHVRERARWRIHALFDARQLGVAVRRRHVHQDLQHRGLLAVNKQLKYILLL